MDTSNVKIPLDVLCVGNASYDIVFSVSRHPQSDEKGFANAFAECGGGPAANAAVTVARMGLKAAFAGYLGYDHYGEKHFQEFVKEGILQDFIVRGQMPTPISVALAKPNGKRTVINYRGETDFLPSNAIDFSRIEPKVILFDGYEPNISPELAQWAKSNSIKTILDAGSVHQGTIDLLPMVDYLVCSQRFALDFTGCNNMRLAVSDLFKFSHNVVCTRGDKGLLWKNHLTSGKFSAFKINPVDTTGAGDSFHGAFAVCIALNKDWEYTLRYASAVAAMCCTKMGARLGIPKKVEVDAFLLENSSKIKLHYYTS